MSLRNARIWKNLKVIADKESNTDITFIAVEGPHPDEPVPAYSFCGKRLQKSLSYCPWLSMRTSSLQ
jgi:hypothetical protein